MVDSPWNCAEGRDASEILAYLEGELSEKESSSLEVHLSSCRVCSEELQRLREVTTLLNAHPESFHPDAADLYRYVELEEDPEGQVSAHLQECLECRDAADVIREMIAVGEGVDASPRPMPAYLKRQVEELYPEPNAALKADQPLSWFAEFLSKPFHVPVLALGTAAALFIAALLVVPMWRAMKEVPQPGATPSQETPLASGQPTESAPKPAAPAVVPEEAPPAAGESRKLKSSQPARRMPSASEPQKQRDGRERARVGTYAAKPGRLHEEADQAASGRSSATEEQEAVGAIAPQRHAASGLPKPQVGEPPVALSPVQRPTVLVRIVGPEGRPLPALAPAIPADLRARYKFIDEAADKGHAPPTLEKKAEITRAKASGEAFRITIKVHETESGYTVEGRLLEKGSKAATKTVTDLDVPVEKLSEEVGRIVRDLLAGR